MTDMLLNMAVPAVISEQNSKIKKTASGRAVPSHMGDSAETTAIMGLGSERHRVIAAASAVNDNSFTFLRMTRLLY